MYTFKKNAWHVRFYYWLFKVNPTTQFKSMCPYFWTYVLVFLFLPLILIIKGFGKYGSQFLEYLESYKRKNREKIKQEFIKLCSREDITSEEAYRIRRSKCWRNNYWYLNYKVENKIDNLYYTYKNQLANEKAKLKSIKLQKQEARKESKLWNAVYTIIGFSVFGIIGYVIYYGFSLIEFRPIGWTAVKEITIGILIIVSGVIVILAIGTGLFYLVKALIAKLACVECTMCKKIGPFLSSALPYIWIPFSFLIKGVVIVIDMIYNTYKKNCPLITWKEDE